MIQDSDEENEGRTILKNKFKAIRNRKPNTDTRREKHKQKEALERARIVDEARRKNKYNAKSLGLKKLGMMDLNFT